MIFVSILFKEPYKLIESEPDFFEDLRLNKIASEIFKEDKRLKAIFYTPLNDKETILYRQEISKEIEKGEISKLLRAFCDSMDTVDEYLQTSKEVHSDLEKNRWILDAADVYCAALINLKEGLKKADPASEGLKKLKEFLENHTSFEPFTSLYYKARSTKKALNAIEYAIFIKENRVRVQKFEGEEDYAKQIESIFSRFSHYTSEKPNIETHSSSIISQLELKILEFVAKLYPDEFSMLEEFAKSHSDFLDNTFVRLKNEMRFYLYYLESIEKLKRKGLSFCYPEISEDNEIYNLDAFDLALAFQITKSTVANDFIMHKEERILLITGPNQGGKTTYARAFGQMHYLFKLGVKVPGKQAKLKIFDAIYTHFERQEQTISLKGKLEDELLGAKKIIQNSTGDSLIIINEAFSSTSLQDGLFLAKKLIEAILSLGARAVFVTFMHKLYEIDNRIVSLTSTLKPDGSMQRSYKIVRKQADGLSYAISLAKKHCLTYQCLSDKLKKRVNK